MKQIQVTTELLQQFRSNPQTLLFEGYCVNFDNVTVYAEDNSYALTAPYGGVTDCCVYTDNLAFVDKVLEILHGNVKFCRVSKFIADYLQNKFTALWRTNCYLYVWNGKQLNTSVIDCDIRPLDPKYAQQVSDGTPYHADTDEVRTCLIKHPSSAVYVDGQAVCWCLLHMEGSLGMLYTVPEFRRKGYALKVMTALSQTVIDKGNVPYAYIIQDNVASLNLAVKYNLQKVCEADYLEIKIN